MSIKYKIEILIESDNFDEWDQFVDESPQGCVFCKSWWLNSVCKNGFRIIIIKNNNKIVAGIPLQNELDGNNNKVHNMPLLTQTLGVLLAEKEENNYKYLSKTMKLIDLLISEIEDYKSFYMQFHYNFTNWLPFYWRGYKQTTRYTYIIPDLNNIDNVFSFFSRRKKRDIKKAKEIVEIKTDILVSDFYNHHKLSLRKNNKNIKYLYNDFKRVYEEAYFRSSGKSWYSIDKNGNICSIIFVIFDKNSAYYLVSSIDPSFKNNGSISLLIWNAMNYFSKKVKIWNFEGSMKKNIEESFRQFGGIQVPYFLITK